MPVGGSRASLNSVLNGSFSAGVPNVRLAPRMGRPGINDLQRYWSCLAYRRHGKASLCRATDATGDVARAHHVMHQAAAASTPAPQSAWSIRTVPRGMHIELWPLAEPACRRVAGTFARGAIDNSLTCHVAEDTALGSVSSHCSSSWRALCRNAKPR